MLGISEEALDQIERAHPDGIPSPQIVAFLDEHGVKFSEATLRKYVQLGLLPHSVRVGRKGMHRGSQGLYPPSVVRKILEIKRLLSENHSIEEIRQDYFLLRGEIEGIEQKLKQLFDSIEGALTTRGEEGIADLVRRDLQGAEDTAAELLTKLRALEARLSARVRVARAAG
jgi:DNA-binding transcriptional MerR regulator